MENYQIILIIIGVVIVVLFIILKMISKKKNKDWLIFQNTDEKNNKISYWGQFKPTGFITEGFESLEKLEAYIKR